CVPATLSFSFACIASRAHQIRFAATQHSAPARSLQRPSHRAELDHDQPPLRPHNGSHDSCRRCAWFPDTTVVSLTFTETFSLPFASRLPTNIISRPSSSALPHTIETVPS